MKFAVKEISFHERDVRLRLPFRFGVVTLTDAPQVFARVRIVLEDNRASVGAAAEMLVPKWFDKNPALSNDDNFQQLRRSCFGARERYLSGAMNTAYGHSRPAVGLVENFGPALIDRALLDALCRALGVSFYTAIRKNAVGIDAPETQGFLDLLKPAREIAARHTVGLLDPIASSDQRINDGLPETLVEVIAAYGHRWFKLKVGGDVQADVERLGAIAAVLDRIPEPYYASLDGNEQFDDVTQVTSLWDRIRSNPKLTRLASSIVFIEQPIKRQSALSADVSSLSEEKPVIIDESDDALDAFPRARALGYRGVSSKTCKGVYKAILNAARCRLWNREAGSARYFMTGEDLTVQAGLAVQQDLALVSLLGLTHVERNGHHYVNGMAGLPNGEQQDFLTSHPDLYEKSHGAVRLKISRGMIAIKSLECPGYASMAAPDWTRMREISTQ